jgi:hypothetical protein
LRDSYVLEMEGKLLRILLLRDPFYLEGRANYLMAIKRQLPGKEE